MLLDHLDQREPRVLTEAQEHQDLVEALDHLDLAVPRELMDHQEPQGLA